MPTSLPTPLDVLRARLRIGDAASRTPLVASAALAQASETPFGCDGLALVTYGDIVNQQQRVLAFSADDALDWLEPALGWEQAQQLAARLNSAQPHLEAEMTTQRPAQGGL